MYQLSLDQIFKQFESDAKNGLTLSKIQDLQIKFGPNILHQTATTPRRKILGEQFTDPLVIVLIIATVVSMGIGDISGGIIIMIIVILNALIGFIQEYKAEGSLEALKKMMSLDASVIREGKRVSIDASEIVPGDIVLLEEGDSVPADGRLLHSNNLEVSESALTGESLPVKKEIITIDADVPLGDQVNMVFSGTTVVKGFGSYIVTATAMNTEIGSIATLINTIDTKPTHLQEQLAALGKKLGMITLIICIVIFLSYYGLHEVPLTQAFLAGVALAVAAIPEGLPAVVTISLSLGIKRMVKKNALMRKLPSVETLGSVDIICTDKTGTLTKNEMTVKEIYVDNTHISVSGTGYDTQGSFTSDSKSLQQLLTIGYLCNHASFDISKKLLGDPTEGCLIISAEKYGLTNKDFQLYTYYDEIPFDSERKMMTSMYEKDNEYHVFSKGAPEKIINQCTQILIDGQIKNITQTDKDRIIKQTEAFSTQAMRVLGFAYKVVEQAHKDRAESDLIFVGLQAIIDPAREEVASAISKCHEAGIKVIMITGDNILTASAIAAKLGIEGKAMTGMDLDNISDEELLQVVDDYAIYARVSPSHKQRLVKLLQSTGKIVAMTGDGVNDAPALKQADIGVAMGITGTDVTKQAADMILLDDNFTTIVSAIEEGRGVYDNIKKFVNYMFSTNLAEVLILFLMSMIGYPLPFLAIHLLWLNLVTDGLPALALGIDPIDSEIMKRKPIPTGSSILDKKMIYNIIVMAVIITIAVVIFFGYWHKIDVEMARSGGLLLLVGLELMRIQIIRSEYKLSRFSNKRLLAALFISIMLMVSIIYTPLNQVFHTEPITGAMRERVIVILGIASILGIGIDRLINKTDK